MPQPIPPLLNYESASRRSHNLCWSAHVWNIVSLALAMTFLTLTVVWVVPRFEVNLSAFKMELPTIGWDVLRYSRWCAGGTGLLFTFLLLAIAAGAVILIDITSRHPDTVHIFSRWYRRILLILCLLWIAAIAAGLLVPILDLLDIIRRVSPRAS